MSPKKPPKWYATLEKRHPAFMDAVQQLGKAVKQEGPWKPVQSQKTFTMQSLS
jgi:hypothetical protein